MPASNPIQAPVDQGNSRLNDHSLGTGEAHLPPDPANVPTDDYPQVAVPPTSMQAPAVPPSQEDNEETLWDGRYSIKNFLGRMTIGGLLVLGWLSLAIDAWGLGRQWLVDPAYVAGAIALFYWLWLGADHSDGPRPSLLAHQQAPLLVDGSLAPPP